MNHMQLELNTGYFQKFLCKCSTDFELLLNAIGSEIRNIQKGYNKNVHIGHIKFLYLII